MIKKTKSKWQLHLHTHYRVGFEILVLILLISIIYLPVFNNQFTNWDDGLYVLNNPYLKSLSFENIKSVFSTYHAGNYHPLTLISLSVDYKFGGLEPWPYHLTNLILHLGNTLLVFFLIKKLFALQQSYSYKFNIIPFVTALLFGIHPFQVESVAWVSERKNVLYAFFFLASLITYIKYLNSKSYKVYCLTLVFFVLSLMSKGMAVPLTLCIILIDYFAGRNLMTKQVIIEKIPFFALSIFFGIIAIFAQRSGDAIGNGNGFSWIERIAVASYGFIQYLFKLCIPHHLSAFYPYPVQSGAPLPYRFYVFVAILLAMFILLWKYFRNNKPVQFGVLFFIANISIVIQLLPVGGAIMADRYMYIPSIGFFVLLAIGLNKLYQKSKLIKVTSLVLFSTYCFLINMLTHQQIGVWKNSITLWTNVITNYPENNKIAFQNRGNAYYDKGQFPEAASDYNQVLQIDQRNAKAHIGLGLIKHALNDNSGAIAHFNKSISLEKSYEGYLNRAVIKMEYKDFEGALIDLNSAAHIEPYNPSIYINKGEIYWNLNNHAQSLHSYKKALELDIQNWGAYIGTGRIKQAQGEIHEAMNDFNTSLSLHPTYEGYLNRAVLKIAMNNYAEALTDLNFAAQIKPDGPETYLNIGVIEMNSGNISSALEEFDKTIALDKSNAVAYLYRGIAKIQLKRKAEACKDFEMSVLLGNTDAKAILNQNCK